MIPGKETISVFTVPLLLMDLPACAGRPCGRRLRGIGGIRKMVRAHPQAVLAQLADMKGVLAEMTDKSRAPRCEKATRHGEANFRIRSKNQ
jgi:hypothetical protein